MSTVKEKIEQVAAIFRDAQQRAEPLLNELGPYIEVAREAERLGITANSTPEQIVDAFAGTLDLSVPVPDDAPELLSKNAPAQIREAGEKITAASRTIGGLVGELGGIVLGLM